MNGRYIVLTAATSLIFVLCASGCGDDHPPVDSSLTEAKVRGVVKIQGKVVPGGGIISFNPSNVERKVASFTAAIAEDGTYELKTYTGGNQVKFTGPFLKANQGLALSSRYCELESGENVVDFDLLGEGDRARGTIYSKKTGKKGAKTP